MWEIKQVTKEEIPENFIKAWELKNCSMCDNLGLVKSWHPGENKKPGSMKFFPFCKKELNFKICGFNGN